MSKVVVNYSWKQFENDMRILAEKIGKGKYTKILAISRGGVIPAYYLARLLGVKVIKTICLESYTADDVRTLIKHHEVNGFSENIVDVSDWLVIDDIVDSGNTIEYMRENFPGIHSASVLYKIYSSQEPEYYGAKVEDDWIEFPWEIN